MNLALTPEQELLRDTFAESVRDRIEPGAGASSGGVRFRRRALATSRRNRCVRDPRSRGAWRQRPRTSRGDDPPLRGGPAARHRPDRGERRRVPAPRRARRPGSARGGRLGRDDRVARAPPARREPEPHPRRRQPRRCCARPPRRRGGPGAASRGREGRAQPRRTGARALAGRRITRRRGARDRRSRDRRLRGGARGVEAAHLVVRRRTRPRGPADRRRLRDRAHPVRPADRHVPGRGPSAGRRRHRRRGGASPRARGALGDRPGPAGGRGTRLDGLRLGRPRPRRGPCGGACTRTAATGSRSSTTSSSTTGAPRRSRSLAGDPSDELLRVADRLWNGARVSLPDVGAVPFDFELGEAAEAFRAQGAHLLRGEPHRRAARARALLLGRTPSRSSIDSSRRPASPSPRGPASTAGEERGVYEQMALEEEFYRAGWTTHALGTTRMVGATLMRFASDELKREVLPRIASGDAVTALGYTEPGVGLGRRRGADPRGARRRRLGDQRTEDVHERRERRSVRLPPDPHRPRGEEAPRAHHVPGAARHPRHRDPGRPHAERRADEHHLLLGRADPRPLSDRRGERRLGRRGVRARARARRHVPQAPARPDRRGRAMGPRGPAGRPAGDRGSRASRSGSAARPRTSRRRVSWRAGRSGWRRRGARTAAKGRCRSCSRRRSWSRTHRTSWISPLRPPSSAAASPARRPTVRSSSPIGSHPRPRSTPARARSCAASSPSSRSGCRAVGAERSRLPHRGGASAIGMDHDGAVPVLRPRRPSLRTTARIQTRSEDSPQRAQRTQRGMTSMNHIPSNESPSIAGLKRSEEVDLPFSPLCLCALCGGKVVGSK